MWCERSGGVERGQTQISVIEKGRERDGETERYKETDQERHPEEIIEKTERQRNRRQW